MGEALLGRVVGATGVVLDHGGALHCDARWPIERPAPAIIDCAPVTVPLQTGCKAVDALIPIGRGQRELILGDRQTGKTALAVDTVINQRGRDVVCVYCAVGQRGTAVARVVDTLRRHAALSYTVASRLLPTFTMNPQVLLASLLHQYLFAALFRACADSQASEHASRLAAMQSAQRNLDERIEELTRLYRRARQSSITAQLLDIVSGFEVVAPGAEAKGRSSPVDATAPHCD